MSQLFYYAWVISIISGAIYLISAGSSDFIQNYHINPLLYKVYSADQFSDILMYHLDMGTRYLYNNNKKFFYKEIYIYWFWFAFPNSKHACDRNCMHLGQGRLVWQHYLQWVACQQPSLSLFGSDSSQCVARLNINDDVNFNKNLNTTSQSLHLFSNF